MKPSSIWPALLLGVGLLGCSLPAVQQPAVASAPVPTRPLPFKGKLVSGNVNELPPALAMSLSSDSPISFSYREDLTHDEYHIPLAVSAFDPVTYFGAPLGDYGVTAVASLSIFEGDRVLGDYRAKAFVSKSYSLYSEPTHKELEDAARAEVRERIERKLYSDENRLTMAAAGAENPPDGSLPR
ncbi:MAG TPA: hypothetical protein VJN94_18225 [Candidatus Binataceae bacterium]|nr:hypothetical protein [Candidatus Binataceae bacterium]